jgi:hypothetical protein
MKKLVLILVVLATLVGCVKPTSRRNYKYTLSRDNGLYIEVYKAGILGRSKAEYLTDSINFRQHIGTFDDEKEQIHCRINGNRIEVERRERVKGEGRQQDVQIVVSTTVYDLRELKRKRVFEE